MAFTISYIAAPTLRDSLKNAIALNVAGTSPDTLNLALFNNSFAGTVTSDDPSTYGSGSYGSNEVTGTNWAAGGVALVSPTNTTVAGVGINFAANNVSQATVTVSGAAGCVIYDNTLSPKAVLCAIQFGGSFSSTAGTFAITWGTANSVTSIWYILMHS